MDPGDLDWQEETLTAIHRAAYGGFTFDARREKYVHGIGAAYKDSSGKVIDDNPTPGFVATIKDTSLGYIIGLTEVSFIASQINVQVLTKSTQVYFILSLTYFILCFGLSRFAFWLEKTLNRRSTPTTHRVRT